MLPDKQTGNFNYEEGVIEKLNLDQNFNKTALDRNKFQKFLEETNNVFHSDEFNSINTKFSKSRCLNFAGSILCILFIIGLITLSLVLNLFSFDENSESGIPAWIVLLGFSLLFAIFIILAIRFLIRGLITLHSIKKYDILMYHVNNFSNLEVLLEKWNVDLFIPNGIYVSCPVNLEYLQFNLDPFKDIELENHELRG